MFDFLPCNNCNNKRYFTIAHDLRVDGHHLIERKTKISWKVNGKYGHVKDFVLVYTRIIDGRSYKVTEIQRQKHQQSKVETFMTKDEVKRFEEDWHYVLRVLKTSLWDSRCQTYVFKTKIA